MNHLVSDSEVSRRFFRCHGNKENKKTKGMKCLEDEMNNGEVAGLKSWLWKQGGRS